MNIFETGRSNTSRIYFRVSASVFAVLMLTWLCLAAAPPAHSCEIPVFQYALEIWDTDPYQVTVFHRGGLSAEHREALEVLRAGADHRRLCANVQLVEVNLGEAVDPLKQHLWQQQKGATLPWVVARYPEDRRIADDAWTGPLTVENARNLIESPLRREISRHLLEREVAVWILLESGDRRKDAAAANMLETELARLSQTLRLPHLDGHGPPAGTDDIRFSILRLSRTDPAEQVLVRMLLYSEPDLVKEFAAEPIAFPIYGRGLILYALAGEGINPWTIAQAAQFVTGPCSCVVKSSNPGTDLLIAMDWSANVKQTVYETTPPPTGMADFGDRTEEARERLAALDDRLPESRAVAGSEREAKPVRQAPKLVGLTTLALVLLAAVFTVVARRRRTTTAENDADRGSDG